MRDETELSFGQSERAERFRRPAVAAAAEKPTPPAARGASASAPADVAPSDRLGMTCVGSDRRPAGADSVSLPYPGVPAAVEPSALHAGPPSPTPGRQSASVRAPVDAHSPATTAIAGTTASAAAGARGAAVAVGGTVTGRDRSLVRAARVLLRYGIAVIAVGVALAVTLGFWEQVFSRNQFALFYAAVIVAAWSGGVGPGLLATALAVWSIDYFILPTFISFDHGWQDLIQSGIFAAVSVLVSSLDATRRRAMAALVAARDASESANRAKDNFLAVLSHELRTPLTPALAAAASLEQDPALPAEARSDVGMIRRNIELEARLIDDLLDLTRITRGKLNLRRERVDVHALISHVLEICRADLRTKGLELSLDLRCPAPYVCADPARMNQVLWNLVKNAIKFTPRGGRVTIRTAGQDDPEPSSVSLGTAECGGERRAAGGSTSWPSWLVLEVRDTGIGIEPHVLPRIFDAFEQGERTNSHRFGGLGLGLAITKALVYAHGGDLTAASEGAGRGATFTMRLPLTAAPEMVAGGAAGAAVEPPVAPAVLAAPRVAAAIPVTAADPAAPPAEMAPAEPPAALRVLLVEDHADTARMMARLLRACRYEVRTAGSVGDAVAAAEGGSFDLLISDLGLPDGTGLDLIRLLRARPHVEPFRAIALSGYGMEEDLRQTREAGFAAHLTKPVSFDDLNAVIRNVTGQRAA